MFLDADDLVHKDILAYVLAHAHGSYVVDQGYVLDLSSGVLWHRREGFHLTCGSSFVCRFARDELPSSWEDDASPFAQFGSALDQRGHSRLRSGGGRARTPAGCSPVSRRRLHGESQREPVALEDGRPPQWSFSARFRVAWRCSADPRRRVRGTRPRPAGSPGRAACRALRQSLGGAAVGEGAGPRFPLV